jgi:hypothetical protein
MLWALNRVALFYVVLDCLGFFLGLFCNGLHLALHLGCSILCCIALRSLCIELSYCTLYSIILYWVVLGYMGLYLALFYVVASFVLMGFLLTSHSTWILGLFCFVHTGLDRSILYCIKLLFYIVLSCPVLHHMDPSDCIISALNLSCPISS